MCVKTILMYLSCTNYFIFTNVEIVFLQLATDCENWIYYKLTGWGYLRIKENVVPHKNLERLELISIIKCEETTLIKSEEPIT